MREFAKEVLDDLPAFRNELSHRLQQALQTHEDEHVSGFKTKFLFEFVSPAKKKIPRIKRQGKQLQTDGGCPYEREHISMTTTKNERKEKEMANILNLFPCIPFDNDLKIEEDPIGEDVPVI